MKCLILIDFFAKMFVVKDIWIFKFYRISRSKNICEPMVAFKSLSIIKIHISQKQRRKNWKYGILSKQFLRNLDEISRSIRNKGNTFSALLFASAETRYRETSVGIKFISRQYRKISTYISNRKIKLVYPFYVSFFALFFSYQISQN